MKPFGCVASPPFPQRANQGPATKSQPELEKLFSAPSSEQVHPGRAAAPPASPRSGSHELLQSDTSHPASSIASFDSCRINSTLDQPFPSRAATHHRALRPALSFHRSSRAKRVHTQVRTSICCHRGEDCLRTAFVVAETELHARTCTRASLRSLLQSQASAREQVQQSSLGARAHPLR